jgi:hypothetical protein
MTIKGNKEDRSAAVYSYFQQVREATAEQVASVVDILLTDAFGCIRSLTRHGLLGCDKTRPASIASWPRVGNPTLTRC